MPIQFKYDPDCDHNPTGEAGTHRPLVFCDFCGDRIEEMENCFVEAPEDAERVFFCHKDQWCQEKFRRSRSDLCDLGWQGMEMGFFLSAVANNLDPNHPEVWYEIIRREGNESR